MRAGHAAIISAALTALILIALLSQIAPNAPYLPKATTTKTETLTKTTTLTTTQTTVSTATLTQTVTHTKTLPITTTLTTTKTETITESTFQYLSKPRQSNTANSTRKQNRDNLHTLPTPRFPT